jgi:hypothetical protein
VYYEIWKTNNNYSIDEQQLFFKEVNVKKELMKIPTFYFSIPRNPDSELTAPALGDKIKIYRNYGEMLRGTIVSMEVRRDTLFFEGVSSADEWSFINTNFSTWSMVNVSVILNKFATDIGWTLGGVDEVLISKFDYDYTPYYNQLDRLATWVRREYLFDEPNKKLYFQSYVGTDKSADIRFKRGVNLNDFTVKKDQDETWDRVLCLGSGDGKYQLRAVRGSGSKTKVFTDKSIKTQADLNKFADEKLAEGNQPAYIYYEAEIDPPLFNFDIGDTVWIEDDLNRVNEPMRVMAFSLTFNETESIDVTFANRRKTLTDFFKKMDLGQRTLENVHHSSAVQKGTMIQVDDENDPIAFEVTDDTLTNVSTGNTIGDIEKKINDVELEAGEATEQIGQIIEAKPNLVKQGYDSFEQITLPYSFPFYSASTTVKDLDTTHALDGVVSLKVEGTASDNYVFLGLASDDYNIPLINGKTYIASCYAYNPSATPANVRLVARANTGSYFFGTSTPISSDDGWTKLTIKFIADTTITSCVLRVDTQTPSIPVWFDCFKVEEVDQASTTATPWTPATITAIDASRITTGYLSFDRAKGGTLSLGGDNNQDGKFYLLNADQETIAEMDGATNVISFDTVRAGTVISSSLVPYNSLNKDIYIDFNTGDDELGSSTMAFPYRTISRALQDVPQFNDGTINIYFLSDGVETVNILGVGGGGSINFYFQNHQLDGFIGASGCTNTIRIEGGTINFQGSETYGVIKFFRCPSWYVINMKLFGRSQAQYGLVTNDSCQGQVTGTYFNGALNYSIACQYGSYMIINGCSGTGATYGIYANSATITGSGTLTAPAGTSSNTRLNGGGEIKVTFTFPTGSGTVPSAPKTTQSWNSVSGRSYRSSYVVGWRSEADVRQGQWQGYGLHTGCWFFGSAPSTAVTGKTITQMRITLTRLSTGGNSGAMTYYIHPHAYTSQPAGAPSVISNYVTATFAWGQTKTITVTDPSFLSQFSSGTAKGICLYLNSASASDYGIFDDSAKIEFTYS